MRVAEVTEITAVIETVVVLDIPEIHNRWYEKVPRAKLRRCYFWAVDPCS
jgi:ssDNA-specific exonuclease RecJ